MKLCDLELLFWFISSKSEHDFRSIQKLWEFNRKVRSESTIESNVACKVIIICFERIVNVHNNGHFAIRHFYSRIDLAQYNRNEMEFIWERTWNPTGSHFPFLLFMHHYFGPINNQYKILYANLFRARLNWKQTEILMFFITSLCDVIKLSNKDLSINY